jgi:hypothetical protein
MNEKRNSTAIFAIRNSIEHIILQNISEYTREKGLLGEKYLYFLIFLSPSGVFYLLKKILIYFLNNFLSSCTICGKTSATKTNHNKHIKIHHARDPLTAEG